ncbi:MAG: hypothetical protein JO040_11755 [Gemmatimonadetes bacterium]|nr:hypothetical protein [Gemmatimonadota bacterium]
MTVQTPESRAAGTLLEQKEAIARAVTDTLYRERPYLMERYGQRGWDRTLEDMHFNVEHLIPAVDLQEPGMFAGYVRWLDGLLRARNVPTREVVRCLELLEDESRSRMDDEAAESVATILHAGLAALPGDDGR